MTTPIPKEFTLKIGHIEILQEEAFLSKVEKSKITILGREITLLNQFVNICRNFVHSVNKTWMNFKINHSYGLTRRELKKEINEIMKDYNEIINSQEEIKKLKKINNPTIQNCDDEIKLHKEIKGKIEAFQKKIQTGKLSEITKNFFPKQSQELEQTSQDCYHKIDEFISALTKEKEEKKYFKDLQTSMLARQASLTNLQNSFDALAEEKVKGKSPDYLLENIDSIINVIKENPHLINIPLPNGKLPLDEALDIKQASLIDQLRNLGAKSLKEGWLKAFEDLQKPASPSRVEELIKHILSIAKVQPEFINKPFVGSVINGKMPLHLAFKLGDKSLIDGLLQPKTAMVAFTTAVQVEDLSLCTQIFETTLVKENKRLEAYNLAGTVDRAVGLIKTELDQTIPYKILEKAIKENDFPTFVETLEKDANCLVRNENLQTLLHQTALHNNPEFAVYLIFFKHFNIGLKDKSGQTFLDLAKQQAGFPNLQDTEVCEKILKSISYKILKQAIEKKDTSLFVSSMTSLLNYIGDKKHLGPYTSPPDSKEPAGKNPLLLDFAAEHGCREIAYWLSTMNFAKTAVFDAFAKKNKWIEHSPQANNNTEVEKILQDIQSNLFKILNRLTNKNAFVITNDFRNIVQAIESGKMSANKLHENGYSLLYFAIQKDDLPLLYYLLQKHAENEPSLHPNLDPWKFNRNEDDLAEYRFENAISYAIREQNLSALSLMLSVGESSFNLEDMEEEIVKSLAFAKKFAQMADPYYVTTEEMNQMYGSLAWFLMSTLITSRSVEYAASYHWMLGSVLSLLPLVSSLALPIFLNVFQLNDIQTETGLVSKPLSPFSESFQKRFSHVNSLAYGEHLTQSSFPIARLMSGAVESFTNFYNFGKILTTDDGLKRPNLGFYKKVAITGITTLHKFHYFSSLMLAKYQTVSTFFRLNFPDLYLDLRDPSTFPNEKDLKSAPELGKKILTRLSEDLNINQDPSFESVKDISNTCKGILRKIHPDKSPDLKDLRTQQTMLVNNIQTILKENAEKYLRQNMTEPAAPSILTTLWTNTVVETARNIEATIAVSTLKSVVPGLNSPIASMMVTPFLVLSNMVFGDQNVDFSDPSKESWAEYFYRTTNGTYFG